MAMCCRGFVAGNIDAACGYSILVAFGRDLDLGSFECDRATAPGMEYRNSSDRRRGRCSSSGSAAGVAGGGLRVSGTRLFQLGPDVAAGIACLCPGLCCNWYFRLYRPCADLVAFAGRRFCCLSSHSVVGASCW